MPDFLVRLESTALSLPEGVRTLDFVARHTTRRDHVVLALLVLGALLALGSPLVALFAPMVPADAFRTLSALVGARAAKFALVAAFGVWLLSPHRPTTPAFFTLRVQRVERRRDITNVLRFSLLDTAMLGLSFVSGLFVLYVAIICAVSVPLGLPQHCPLGDRTRDKGPSGPVRAELVLRSCSKTSWNTDGHGDVAGCAAFPLASLPPSVLLFARRDAWRYLRLRVVVNTSETTAESRASETRCEAAACLVFFSSSETGVVVSSSPAVAETLTFDDQRDPSTAGGDGLPTVNFLTEAVPLVVDGVALSPARIRAALRQRSFFPRPIALCPPSECDGDAAQFEADLASAAMFVLPVDEVCGFFELASSEVDPEARAVSDLFAVSEKEAMHLIEQEFLLHDPPHSRWKQQHRHACGGGVSRDSSLLGVRASGDARVRRGRRQRLRWKGRRLWKRLG